MKLKICMIFLILATIDNCSSNMSNDLIKMEWVKIANTGKPVDYCLIDSLSVGYIIAYSHSASIKGGFKIMKLNSLNQDILEKESLFESSNNTAQFVSIEDDNIGFVQEDFEENTIRSKFFLSHNLGKTWNEIATPLEGSMRNFILKGKFLLIEGNLKGTGQIFESSDFGQTWDNINTLRKGFKSFYLLSSENDKILCKGSKSFNSKDCKLLLFDIENNSIEELVDIGDNSFSYVKPISKEGNLHGILDGKKLNIYSLEEEKMTLKEKFKLPNDMSWVENVFLSAQYYIVTVREDKSKGQKFSWISYDKGKNWQPFEHEKKIQLIYNTFGKLFVIDMDNNILLSYPL